MGSIGIKISAVIKNAREVITLSASTQSLEHFTAKQEKFFQNYQIKLTLNLKYKSTREITTKKCPEI